VRVLSAPELRSSWFWGGGDGDAEPCTASAQNNWQSTSRLLLLPFAERGAGPGPSGVKKRGGRGKGTLGEGEERH